MSAVLYLFIVILLLLFSRSKALALCSLLFVGAWGSICTSCADIVNYSNSYNIVQSGILGRDYFGFEIMERLFVSLGFDFPSFRFAVLCISLILIWLATCLLSSYPGFPISLYLVYSYGIDYVQMKHLLAFGIALVGIAVVLKARQARSRPALMGFGVLISAISVMVHPSYLVIILVELFYLLLREKNHFNRRVFLLFITILILTYSGVIAALISYGSSFGIRSVDYLETYTGSSMGWGLLLPIFVATGCIAAVRSAGAIAKDGGKELLIDQGFINLVLLILPLMIFQMSFLRLVRPFVFLAYIALANHCKGSLLKLPVISICMIALAIGAAFYADILGNYDMTLGALLSTSLF